MVERQSVCLRQLGASRAGQVQYGRWLGNGRVTVEALVEGVCKGVGVRSQGRHVLLVEDTTEVNYQAHARRVQGLGTVGNGVDAGLFAHPVLVIDAQEEACLGLAHIHLWQRTQGKAKNYRALPIEEKESYRWVEAIERARGRLQGASQMTVVADREGDIYEMWSRLPDQRTQLLIRACRDRNVEPAPGGHTGLYAWLQAQPLRGQYTLAVPASARRSAHDARMQVRFGRIRIRRPLHCSDAHAPQGLDLWALEVREEAASVAQGDEPVHWRLLTTHRLENVEQALQCVHWYCQRWHIEQTFRTLKRQGLDIESSLVEQAPRLEKLVVMALSAATHTMQLTLARQGNSARPATDCFAPGDAGLLEHVGASLEGKTLKQKNPHPAHSLAWAAWIVARLGGWMGYASERKPGPLTMLHGLQALARIRTGWELARATG
jgi:hypothetical protein